ncbi:hypothetical protein SMSP2_00177 [Limihaloglobus sulfuriphilus]|uniref:Carboxypeptidase regulatory-like domain-containing protein n=1 Tax=Limihaloglobus sulfuriphilus TaxID=1851148 RepID=A0A1Q2MAU1_9BACT|nr:hypothetical protein [Limihaloglobus sulfuriphilus]AQQ69843.1 hypothetical protein SMSP2_00177 [Limihaloglobus sulfuriphilus]
MRTKFLILVSAVLFTVSSLTAVPNAWVSANWSDGWNSSSFRSPVTNGHMNLYVLVDNVTFTDAVFSVDYDPAVVSPLGTGSVYNIMSGLSVESAVTTDLENGWKRTAFTVTGSVIIGETQYTSDAFIVIRLIPAGEGVQPVGLWQDLQYPASYKTCSLQLWNEGTEISFEPKEWNDEVELFSFTDNTGGLNFFYDMNFGYPLSDGVLRITYNDSSVEEITQSDPERGISLIPAYGAFFLEPQSNASSYEIIFPAYGAFNPSTSAGRYTSHSAPAEMLSITDGLVSETAKASDQDLVLKISSPELGKDFQTSTYSAAIAGGEAGPVEKDFTFAYVDDETIELTILSGLSKDYYTLYITKNDSIAGQTWFSCENFYFVNVTVKDISQEPVEAARVFSPTISFGMEMTVGAVEDFTDANGQASLELPGSEWGMFHNIKVSKSGFQDASDDVEMYDSDVSHEVTLLAAPSVNAADFAGFNAWWGNTECFWDDFCQGYDRNYDNAVNVDDLLIFLENWLKE